ncbi:alpha-ketoglutarate-dependent dioxygenase AlkB [uncultured Psychroserpens sp.]|uniref:alpha-ketoglutarate-dependent dioxygenase AlkB n=1 Tax=uncultured Psychroserpens sp. TaxID=255436 RepID=UPI002625B1A8|nr:alpha-ketoglutarate-dependent dioxygenase AlkB [uncultured Psychroserpens sp.]
MEGIIYRENFLDNHESLFETLKNTIIWDERMLARKTASYGKAYNYSSMEYPFQPFTPNLKDIIESINSVLHFRPNNCLINYYEDGNSSMGFHSDQIDILEKNTGVVIISIGEIRTLRFRNIKNRETIVDFNLVSGSLIYMTNEIQKEWQHSIPKSNIMNGRMSLTFRKLK